MASPLVDFINKKWDSDVIPKIEEYVAIPNQSPNFDTEWNTNGLIDKAAHLLMDWALKQDVKGIKGEFIQEPNRTPVLFFEIPGVGTDNTILMYGHLDKQPPMTESWDEGLGPYKPVIKDGKLYGRGSADDGYSIFTAITSIKALQEQNLPHSRIIVFIEASEESGSPDLDTYIDKLKSRIGSPTLIICLDSGCGNYEQFWLTTSLRGMMAASLEVSVLSEGVHSGAASGIVPSSFRIIRQLLNRIEDSETGKVLIPACHTNVPPTRTEQMKRCAEALGDTIYKEMPFLEGVQPMSSNLETLLLNRSWIPTISYTGAEGLPPLKSAGNVLRTSTALKLSVRLPPTVVPSVAMAELVKVLSENPPYGAHVKVTPLNAGAGWNSPDLSPWLEQAVDAVSKKYYNKPSNFMGEGGSIPFMGMLGQMFPEAQFVITGVLGPKSNAHGPNEFLHLDFTKKLTCCVADLIHHHYLHFSK